MSIGDPVKCTLTRACQSWFAAREPKGIDQLPCLPVSLSVCFSLFVCARVCFFCLCLRLSPTERDLIRYDFFICRSNLQDLVAPNSSWATM